MPTDPAVEALAEAVWRNGHTGRIWAAESTGERDAQREDATAALDHIAANLPLYAERLGLSEERAWADGHHHPTAAQRLGSCCFVHGGLTQTPVVRLVSPWADA